MQPVITAGAGFLLAVLWFDLMFDVQLLGHDDRVPESTLTSISTYYRRVTTDARPMNRLIATVMLATLLSVLAQLLRHEVNGWVSGLSAASAVVPIGLAGRRTVPNAVRLGRRGDPVGVQSTLARSILRDHLFCFASIAVLLVTQLIWG